MQLPDVKVLLQLRVRALSSVRLCRILWQTRALLATDQPPEGIQQRSAHQGSQVLPKLYQIHGLLCWELSMHTAARKDSPSSCAGSRSAGNSAQRWSCAPRHCACCAACAPKASPRCSATQGSAADQDHPGQSSDLCGRGTMALTVMCEAAGCSTQRLKTGCSVLTLGSCEPRQDRTAPIRAKLALRQLVNKTQRGSQDPLRGNSAHRDGHAGAGVGVRLHSEDSLRWGRREG